MRFDFSDEAKETFYQKAEERLEAAGVDFLKVDRTGIGVRHFNPDRMDAEVVIVDLVPYPYANLSNKKIGMCKEIEGWHRTNKRSGTPMGNPVGTLQKEIHMRSRIEFPDLEERRKDD